MRALPWIALGLLWIAGGYLTGALLYWIWKGDR